MRFSVRDDKGSVWETNGTNIVPVPTGTVLVAWAVNDFWYDAKERIVVNEDGDVVVDFESIRRAFRDGAPKVPPKRQHYVLWSPPTIVLPPTTAA